MLFKFIKNIAYKSREELDRIGIFYSAYTAQDNNVINTRMSDE